MIRAIDKKQEILDDQEADNKELMKNLESIQQQIEAKREQER